MHGPRCSLLREDHCNTGQVPDSEHGLSDESKFHCDPPCPTDQDMWIGFPFEHHAYLTGKATSVSTFVITPDTLTVAWSMKLAFIDP